MAETDDRTRETLKRNLQNISHMEWELHIIRWMLAVMLGCYVDGC